ANYSFLMLNPNKKSVTLNLKDTRARDIMLKLLTTADVIVENYLEGVMESFGLGYDELAGHFPRLIYACGRGFGSGTRWAKLGAMDNTIQAASGVISITGFADHGVKTSATFIDMGTGSHLVSGILAALLHRERTGRGQKVEVAMHDVAIPALTSVLAPVLQGRKFKRLGNRHWGACPTNVYPVRDGEILLFCLTEAHWQTLARLMGREDLLSNEHYKDHGSRLRIADEVDAIVADWTRTHARDEILQLMIEKGIPSAPVREVEEVIEDPEVACRGALVDMDYPGRGRVRVAGSPIKLSAVALQDTPSAPPPGLGEHTDQILGSIGVTPEEIAKLRNDGVI
ncbi:MAG TPA: CoA transferase, partial [Candidatus Binataceae bacterium]|nr:CoA transferase [Candidatus Binataceae bacterium]